MLCYKTILERAFHWALTTGGAYNQQVKEAGTGVSKIGWYI